MKTNKTPTRERLYELFYYDNGWLHNRINRTYNAKAGEIAGCIKSCLKGNYRFVTIDVDGVRYKAHRLIYKMFNDENIDGCEIDHIDGNPLNNKLENLRLVTHRANMLNQKLRNTNKSGRCGVSKSVTNNKWRSTIWDNNKQIELGTYNTLQDAIRARAAAEKNYGYHKNHGRV